MSSNQALTHHVHRETFTSTHIQSSYSLEQVTQYRPGWPLSLITLHHQTTWIREPPCHPWKLTSHLWGVFCLCAVHFHSPHAFWMTPQFNCLVVVCLQLCSFWFLFRFWLLLCFSVDLLSYVTRFQWDKAKYPTALPLDCLAELISKVQTNDINNDYQCHVNMVITLQAYTIYHCTLAQMQWNTRNHESEIESIFSSIISNL